MFLLKIFILEKYIKQDVDCKNRQWKFSMFPEYYLKI